MTYREEEKQTIKTLLEELNALGSNYKFKMREIANNPGLYEVVSDDEHEIKVKPRGYDKKYHFFSGKKYQYVDFYQKKEIEEKIGAPQNVGKLHRNKINAWCDYLIAVDKELAEISQETIRKVEDFVKKAEDSGVTVKYPTDNYGSISGRMERGGILYTFEINKQNGYISENVEVYPSYKVGLDAFLKMSNNKHTA